MHICLTSNNQAGLEEALGCRCAANTLERAMQLNHEHKQLTKNKNRETE